jgi:hypothetical protein
MGSLARRQNYLYYTIKKNPYGRILDFLDRSRYYFFQVAPQL